MLIYASYFCCNCDCNSAAQQTDECIRASTNQTKSTIYDANVNGSNKTIITANNNNKTLFGSRAYCNQEAKTLDHQGTLALSKNLWPKKPRIQPVVNEAQELKID